MEKYNGQLPRTAKALEEIPGHNSLLLRHPLI
jgi:hypothetical protein